MPVVQPTTRVNYHGFIHRYSIFLSLRKAVIRTLQERVSDSLLGAQPSMGIFVGSVSQDHDFCIYFMTRTSQDIFYRDLPVTQYIVRALLRIYILYPHS